MKYIFLALLLASCSHIKQDRDEVNFPPKVESVLKQYHVDKNRMSDDTIYSINRNLEEGSREAAYWGRKKKAEELLKIIKREAHLQKRG